MQIDSVFNNFIAYQELNISNKEDIVAWCKDRVIDNDGIFVDPSETVFNELGGAVTKCLDELHTQLEFSDEYEQRIKQFWVNSSFNQPIVRPHRHPDGFFSAVYWPLADEDASPLGFISPNQQLAHVVRPEYVKNFNSMNSEQLFIPPKTDLLLVSPCWMWHFVAHKEGNSNNRFSIAFDSVICKKD